MGGFFEFTTPKPASKHDKSAPACPHITPSTRERRCAFQLFRSLIPILFHTSLWDLPTSVVETRVSVLNGNEDKEDACIKYFSHGGHLSRNCRYHYEDEVTSSNFVPEVSSRALHGNAALISEVNSAQ